MTAAFTVPKNSENNSTGAPAPFFLPADGSETDLQEPAEMHPGRNRVYKEQSQYPGEKKELY